MAGRRCNKGRSMKIHTRRTLLALAALLAIGGCHRASPPDTAAKAADSKENSAKASGEITLTSEQVQKIGLQSEPLKAISPATEVAGFGTVLSRDAIVQSLRELATAG